jgi:nitrite reductase/ring-hydroxylating ferredoxin subunit
MTRHVSVPEIANLANDARLVHETDGVSVLIVRHGQQCYAIENRCPHRGAPLAQAGLKDGCLTCPWHGMKFDLSSGASTTDDALRLTSFPIRQHDDAYFLELPDAVDSKSIATGVRVALVRYGATGQLGWFGTIHDLPLHRAAQVVIETALGPQLGEILLGEEEVHRQPPEKNELRGEITHLAIAEDFERNRRASDFASQHFPLVKSRLDELSHSAIELESTLDQSSLLVWLLSTPDASLGKLSSELAATLGVQQVRFLERRQTDAPVAATTRYNEKQSPRNSRKEGDAMRGPGLRQKNELDRLWECPNCQYHERTSGTQTTLVCPKCIKPEAGARTHFMKLVTSPPTAPRRSFQVVSNTPVPVPVVTILGEDTTRVPKKQSLRPAPAAISSEPDTAPTSDAANAEMRIDETQPSANESLPTESPSADQQTPPPA